MVHHIRPMLTTGAEGAAHHGEGNYPWAMSPIIPHNHNHGKVYDNSPRCRPADNAPGDPRQEGNIVPNSADQQRTDWIDNRAAKIKAVDGKEWASAVEQATTEYDQQRHRDGTRPHLRAVDADEQGTAAYPRPGDPTNVARRILADLFTEQGTYTLRHWRGDWYRWTGPCWTPVTDEELTGDVWLHLDAQTYRGKEGENVPWCPVPGKISGVRQALLHLVHLPDDNEAPMWIGVPGVYAPDSIIGVDNGLLVWTDRQLIEHTPNLFNVYALPYNYTPSASAPRWSTFLGETFAHDPAGAEALQEFFGYVLTGDNSRQKGLMIIGPPRGGKGTISNVLTDMVGTGNVASTGPKALDSEFGMWPLIGKPLAVLSDARTDGPIKAGALENLLKIMGGDPVSINRKGVKFWNGYLPTRFLWISNDLPRFKDNSGAISTRWVVVRLATTVAEKNRDPNLGEKLRQELPGILNWALDGLKELNNRGSFTVPETQAETLEDLNSKASPVRTFLQECYEITGDQEDIVPISDVLKDYRAWCEDNGHSPVNRDELMDRIKGCSEPVDAKSEWIDSLRKKKQRRAFGIVRQTPGW
jgi:putative DNA primase/helicase